MKRDLQRAEKHAISETSAKYLLKHNRGGNAIRHVERLPDGRLVFLYHSVCEHCRLCEEQGDTRDMDLADIKVVPWRDDPLYPEEP